MNEIETRLDSSCYVFNRVSSIQFMPFPVRLFPDITTDMTVWDGVIVTPSDRAYERKDEEEEKEDGNNTEKMDV
jgi:hypothetical protein